MPIKKRTTTHEPLSGSVERLFHDPATLGTWTRTPNVPRFFECMSDELTGHRRYGNCSHVKTQYTNYPGYVQFTTQPNGHTCSADMNYIYSHVDLGFGNVVSDPPPNFSGEAFSAMKPSLSNSLSMTNFLLELREFSDLKDIFKDFDLTSLRKFRKGISGDFLNYSFGWMPTISDFKAIYESCVSFEKLLRDYKSRSGSQQVRHFQKILPDITEQRYPGTPNAPHTELLCKRTISNRVYNATMKFTYSIEGIDQGFDKLRAVMDVFGLKFGMAVIWEAIPYSFLIDWFLNVGDYLGQFDTDALNSVVHVIDFCHSYTANINDDWYLKNWGTHWHNFGVHDCRLYKRIRCIPDTKFGFMGTGRYGVKQIALSAALLGS